MRLMKRRLRDFVEPGKKTIMIPFISRFLSQKNDIPS